MTTPTLDELRTRQPAFSIWERDLEREVFSDAYVSGRFRFVLSLDLDGARTTVPLVDSGFVYTTSADAIRASADCTVAIWRYLRRGEL